MQIKQGLESSSKRETQEQFMELAWDGMTDFNITQHIKSQSIGQEEAHSCNSVAGQAVWEPQHGEEGLHVEWCEAPGVGVRMVWSVCTEKAQCVHSELEKNQKSVYVGEKSTMKEQQNLKILRKVFVREISLAKLFRVWMSKENIQKWGKSCVRCQNAGRTKTGAQRRKASSGTGRWPCKGLVWFRMLKP